MKFDSERHKHFYWAENKCCFPNEEFIIHMAEPRCFIRFDMGEAMTTDYDLFYESIADVQWIDGRPDEADIERVLTDAWNFLAREERKLEEDMDNMEGEPFDEFP